ncbi:MAG: DNA internalization-related competence protein ComEC/Rec2 [Desulfuromonadaceae bacterium]|nr:DNA internalization-related competence protein ComEC/Rec2 [Desulfuromonadaceae bacterium]
MPLIPVLLTATLAGLLLAPFYTFPQTIGWLLTFACLAAAFAGRNNSRLWLIFLFVSFFLCANLRYPLQFPSSAEIDHISSLHRKVAVTAEIISVRQLAGGRSQFDLQMVHYVDKDKIIPVVEPVLLRLSIEEGDDSLLPGDRVQFRSRLRKPRQFGTPGEFHWPRYLASQGVAMTAWVKNAEQITFVTQGDVSPGRAIARWKGLVARKIAALLPDTQAALVRALVLGESRLLSADTRKKLACGGVSHLFAISGLHLGLIGLLGYRLLLFGYRRSETLLNFQPPQRLLPMLLLPLLLGYLLLTGDAVSTRRAFSLAAAGAVLLYWRHVVSPLRLLLSLALLFLLAAPLSLWHPGWQLSFAGATGILLWRPIWQNFPAALPWMIRGPVRLLLVTLSATLSTLPLVLVNFHLLATAGVLANLLAVPVVALCALPVGLCGLLLLPLSSVLAEGAFRLCGLLLETTLNFVSWLTSFPGFSGTYLFLSRWQYLAIGLCVVPILLIGQMGSLRRQKTIILSCLCLAGFCWFRPGVNPTQLSLTMFSVGQGESMLLTNDQQQAMLIDGGGLYSKRFDVGERLLAPALGELGIHEFFAVMLTHDHPDHRKGLLFILEHFSVGEFWSGHPLEELHPQLQSVLREKAVPVRQFPPGWSPVSSWQGGKMHVFRGPDWLAKENDVSLVLYLEEPAGGFLLTGDLERQGVKRLIAAGVPGPVAFLKLPHHGSRHSGTEMLLDLLQPQACLVSAGYRNRYRFPAQELVNSLQERNLPLYRTDSMGTIRVRRFAENWQFERWEKGLFR